MSPEEITATATIGLLVATAIYAWLTWRLAKHADKNAEAARQAAQHSEAAAAASARSAAAAEAAVPVDFTVTATATTSKTLLHLMSVGSNVFIHRVELKILVVPSAGGEIYEESATTTINGGIFLHAGEQTFAVINTEIETGSTLLGQALVTYSLDEKGQTRERRVSIGRITVDSL